MKQKVKVIVAFLLVAVLAISAFGCNKREDHDGVLAPDHVLKVEGKVSVLFHVAQTDTEKASVKNWVANFEREYPGVKVETEIALLSQETVDAQIASNSVADVFFVRDTDVYNYAVTQDALMALDDYAEKLKIDTQNVFSAILEMGRVEGRMYAVMRDYNHIVMCYNKELIKEDASLEDPVELDKRGEWTWDTFKDYCERLTKVEDDVTTQVGASMRFGYSPIWIPFVEGFGGKWYDTANKKITFTSDEDVIDGIQEMVDVVESGTVVFNPTGEIHSADITKEGLPVYGTLDPTSQIVFQDIQFPLMASKGKTYEDNDIEWDVVSFPALPTHRVGTGASGFAVFKRNTNPDAAAALCLSLYTEEGQLAYNGQEGGSVPNVKTLAEDDFWRVPFADKATGDDGIYYDAFISHPEADTYGQVECVLPPEIATIIKEAMANIVPNEINNTGELDTTIATLEQQANGMWETLVE